MRSSRISSEIGAALAKPGTGLYFDRGPDSSLYLPHVENRPTFPHPDGAKALGVSRTTLSRLING
ncbi:MAG: hypothetical protein ABSF98_01835 [Bryobacteraceae bacterium]